MTVTDESVYYEDGKFGIRLENVLIFKECNTKFNFGDKGYLTFEHITWGPGPLQSMNSRSVVKVLNNCKSCLRQKVGEAAEYFTNQKRLSCLYIGQWLFMVDIFNTQTTNSLFIQRETFQASKTAGT